MRWLLTSSLVVTISPRLPPICERVSRCAADSQPWHLKRADRFCRAALRLLGQSLFLVRQSLCHAGRMLRLTGTPNTAQGKVPVVIISACSWKQITWRRCWLLASCGVGCPLCHWVLRPCPCSSPWTLSRAGYSLTTVMGTAHPHN